MDPLKMYFLFKTGIFHCYVGYQRVAAPLERHTRHKWHLSPPVALWLLHPLSGVTFWTGKKRPAQNPKAVTKAKAVTGFALWGVSGNGFIGASQGKSPNNWVKWNQIHQIFMLISLKSTPNEERPENKTWNLKPKHSCYEIWGVGRCMKMRFLFGKAFWQVRVVSFKGWYIYIYIQFGVPLFLETSIYIYIYSIYNTESIESVGLEDWDLVFFLHLGLAESAILKKRLVYKH